MNTFKKQLGLTLIEVLVALVVMSIGLLGLAALQTDGLRSESSAIYQTRAIHLVAQMADRIRANPGANPLNYVTPSTTPLTEPAELCNDFTPTEEPCNEFQIAIIDRWNWKQEIENIKTGVPQGFGRVIPMGSASNPGMFDYTIRITWTEPSDTTPRFYENIITY